MTSYKYHEYIDTWIDLVEKRKVYTCNEQKQLCKFIKNVLKDKNVVQDYSDVGEYVRLTEKYFFPLMPDQKFYASLILGLTYKDTKQLVFNQIFITLL